MTMPLLKNSAMSRLITPAGATAPNRDAELMVCAAKCLSAAITINTQIDLDEMYRAAHARVQELAEQRRDITDPATASSLHQKEWRLIRIRGMAIAAREYVRRIEELGVL